MSANIKSVALIGGRINGQAGVVLDALSSNNKFNVVCCYDSTTNLHGTSIANVPVIGDFSTTGLEELREIDYFHISIGDNQARNDIYNKLKILDLKLLSIVHPSAAVSSTASIGEGCFIGPNSVVQNNSKLGSVCIVNSAAVVEHDNVIGNAVHLAPNSSTGGRVTINDMGFIGISATILPDIIIGESAFIGAGSVITKDVRDNTTMIGYAAREHKRNIYYDLDH